MRTTLSASTPIAKAIDAEQNLSTKGLNTASKADMMWRAIRILHEEGKNFNASDILKLCDGISSDYVKKFLINLYFRGIIARTAPHKGTTPASYALIKDEKPDPLFIPPYTYRQLKGSLGTELGAKSSAADKNPDPPQPEKKGENLNTSTDNAPPAAATEQAADKPPAPKPDTNATATKMSTIDEKIAHCILRGYQEDLANKVQQLILFTHKIYEDKSRYNLQEGYLLLDLIRSCLTLYFLKSAQIAGEEIESIISMQRKEDAHA